MLENEGTYGPDQFSRLDRLYLHVHADLYAAGAQDVCALMIIKSSRLHSWTEGLGA